MTNRFLLPSHLKEDTDAEIHKGLGEINDTLPGIIYGHRADG